MAFTRVERNGTCFPFYRWLASFSTYSCLRRVPSFDWSACKHARGCTHLQLPRYSKLLSIGSGCICWPFSFSVIHSCIRSRRFIFGCMEGKSCITSCQGYGTEVNSADYCLLGSTVTGCSHIRLFVLSWHMGFTGLFKCIKFFENESGLIHFHLFSLPFINYAYLRL